MKKFSLFLLVFMLICTPLMALDFFMGATAQADLATYLAYDFTSWGDGFHAKVRFPLGASLLFEVESLPLAAEIAGGYCPALGINLDGEMNYFPFFIEGILYKRENPYQETTLRSYTGGGVGVYFDEIPVFAVLVEGKWLWTLGKHFYASTSVRGGAYFDFLSESDKSAMGFVQLGLGLKAGIGVYF